MFISRVLVESVSVSKCTPNMIAMLFYKVGSKIFFPFRIIGNLFYKAAVFVHLYCSRVRRSLDEARKAKIMVITLP